MDGDNFIRLVVDFQACYGLTAFWRLKLKCGHRTKLTMREGGSPMDKMMPHTFHVFCRSCMYRARAAARSK